MKEELIKLVSENKFNELSFKSKFLHNSPYKFSNKEDLRYLFWLTELQQWVWENFNFYVETPRADKKNFNCFCSDYIYSGTNKIKEYSSTASALEDGLYQVLNNLKDKKICV